MGRMQACYRGLTGPDYDELIDEVPRWLRHRGVDRSGQPVSTR